MPSQAEWDAVNAKLSFKCAYEVNLLPPLSPESDSVFKYARYLQIQVGPKDFENIGRYYRIAAAHGHYKANNNLQLMITGGFLQSPNSQKEVIELTERLLAEGIPMGYYIMGQYVERGYGVEQNMHKAKVLFIMAADRGSPVAQYYVAELLGQIEGHSENMLNMRRCAMEQGYGLAAKKMGGYYRLEKQYADAVLAFQAGVKAGDTLSALNLEHAFSNPASTDELNYHAVPSDPERSRRYKLIGKFIDRNEGRNPKVPDIDQIVPLPPAKLPEWDGTFQWQKERDAAVPPQQPSDELIDRLCKEKGLDPKTGLPLPAAESV